MLTDPVPSSDPWTCPRCGTAAAAAADEPGMVVCANGHRAYAGYLAEAAYLRDRLHWLDDRILGGDPAPDPDTARRMGIWPAPEPGTAAAAAAPGEVVPGHGLQTLLLSLGAFLLIVAGVVFTAVVWERLGAFGQVSVMAAATLGFGVLAVRLVHRLPTTAEALAVVAFGLAVVDAVAAPALGLVPDTWLDVEQPYPAAAACVGAAVSVGLGRRLGLRAWVWLGWLTAAAGAALTTWWLALGPADSDLPWAAMAVTVVALAAVALLAGPYLVAGLEVDLRPMTLAGALGLVLTGVAALVWVSDFDTAAFLGTLVTALVTTGVLLLVWRRTSLDPAGLAAAVLVGVCGGLALLLPVDVDAAWMGAVAGFAGVALLVALARPGHVRVGLLASAALWVTWGSGRMGITATETADGAPVDSLLLDQLAVLLAVVAVTWFVVGWRGSEPVMAWPAAVVGEVGWLAALAGRTDVPDVAETRTLPFAALLLLAGVLWHRSEPTAFASSLGWLGPAVTVALVPSALLCWAAPWVDDASDQSSTEALVRLLVVLAVGVAAVVAGVRLRLGGLLLPGGAALAVAGAAQVWGGMVAVPRWLAIGLAGATLFVLGARAEWLRRQGRSARTFLDSLG